MTKNIIKLSILGLFAAGTILSASAQSTSTATTTNATTTKIVCMQTAVEKRETAIIAAHDAFSVAIKNALVARKSALVAAWGNTDKVTRDAARKTAWSSFKTSAQAAHNAMREARKAVWSTFNTDAKICGVRDHGEKESRVENPTYSY
jgi:hypothetical protein